MNYRDVVGRLLGLAAQFQKANASTAISRAKLKQVASILKLAAYIVEEVAATEEQ